MSISMNSFENSYTNKLWYYAFRMYVCVAIFVSVAGPLPLTRLLLSKQRSVAVGPQSLNVLSGLGFRVLGFRV